MSNQIVISSGAKVRNLDGVLTASTGVVSSVGYGLPNGVATLDGSGKIPVTQLPNSVMEFKGVWNAATNTPTLADGTGNAGDVYLCNVAGTVNFGSGPISFAVGDYAVYTGTVWARSSGATGTVTSVAVTESGDALSITGSPITTSGTINIGFAGTSAQYVAGDGSLITFPALTGYVPYTGATSDVDLGTFSLNAKSLHIKGVGGNGHLGLKHQSATPTGSTNESLLFADVNGNFGWQNDNLYLTTLSTNANTANRTYTFPNASGTVALNNIDNVFTAEQTFSAPIDLNNALNLGFNIAGVGIGSSQLGLYATKASTTSNLTMYDGDTGFYARFAFNNTSNKIYTLPSTSGTLALTSDLSSYVPYTGATGAVNLGPYDLTVNSVVVGKGAGTGGNNVVLGDNALSANTTGSRNVAIGTFPLWKNTTGVGNIAIGAETLINELSGDNNIAIGDNTAKYITTGSSNTIIGPTSDLSGLTTGSYNTILGGALTSLGNISNNIILADGQGNIKYRWDGTNNNLYGNTIFSSTISNGTYTYTLPGATGTLALTSDLSGYLPLTGGTLTGALNGTSAVFSSSVTANGTVAIKGSNALYLYNTDNTTISAILNGGASGVGDMSFYTGGSQKMILTSAGNTGIGTSSPSYLLDVNGTFRATGAATINNNLTVNNGTYSLVSLTGSSFGQVYSTGNLLLDSNTGTYIALRPNGSTEAMRITSAGNVGIGTSSPGQKLSIAGRLNFDTYSTDVDDFGMWATSSGTTLASYSTSNIMFRTANTERMRILTGGQVLIGSTTIPASNYKLHTAGSGGIWVVASNGGDAAYVSQSSTTGYHYYAMTSGAVYYVLTNGDVRNANNSYGAISDISLKENIVDATPKLADLLKVKVRNYNLIADENKEKQLGVIAQELEEIFPNMISEDKQMGKEETIKTVKYSVFVPMLIKAIQELKQEIDELKNK